MLTLEDMGTDEFYDRMHEEDKVEVVETSKLSSDAFEIEIEQA